MYRNKGYGARGNFHQANTTGRTEYNINMVQVGRDRVRHWDHIIQRRTQSKLHTKNILKKTTAARKQKPRVKTQAVVVVV